MIRCAKNRSRRLRYLRILRATASAARRFINDSSAISFRMIIRGPGEIFIVAVRRSSWNSVALAASARLRKPPGAPLLLCGISVFSGEMMLPARGTSWYMQQHFRTVSSAGEQRRNDDTGWSDVRDRTGKRGVLGRNGRKKTGVLRESLALAPRCPGKPRDYRR